MLARLLLVTCCITPLIAQAAGEVRRFEDARLEVSLSPRTPEQIAAFYIGRKFPEVMVRELQSHCFITVGIRNTSDQVIWLDLDHWRVHGPEGPVTRYDRAHWKARWEALEAPLPAQATFRWTLLPETLDFRPGEAEGGNIVLPSGAGPYTIEARFETGADRAGAPIELRLGPLRCGG